LFETSISNPNPGQLETNFKKPREVFSKKQDDIQKPHNERNDAKVIMRNELVVQKHHVPLVTEKERVIVPKHFAAHPWYHRSENDYFMYSIHNMVNDEIQNQPVEEKSIDLMCMIDDFLTWMIYPSMINMMMIIWLKSMLTVQSNQ
jgi:hypothetical protein